MRIIIESHTLKRALERGADETEIEDVLNNGFEIPANYNRLAKVKVYEFNPYGMISIINKKELK